MFEQFHLVEILAAAKNLPISGEELVRYYALFNYMTGETGGLWNHQIGRVQLECQPHLLKQLPWLEAIDVTGVTPNNRNQWLQEQAGIYGEEHEIQPIPSEDHKKINPIVELFQLIGAVEGDTP